MGNKPKKKSLSDLKKSLQTIKKKDLSKIKGGKKRGGNWKEGCGDIVPQ